MHHFQHRGDDLYCEEIPVARIADEVGTPVYIYSHATLTRHFRALDEAFAPVPHLVCFALKANANLAVLKLFSDLGGGLDVVSGGELFRGLAAGVPPQRIVYAGVGKTRRRSRTPSPSDILMFNVESDQELTLHRRGRRGTGRRARVALRVNPDVDPKTHPYIATGLSQSKFGIDIGQAVAEYECGRSACRRWRWWASTSTSAPRSRRSSPSSIPWPDGGRGPAVAGTGQPISVTSTSAEGWGSRTTRKLRLYPLEFAKALIGVVRDLGVTVILEPGRVLVGNAGILVTRVLYTKQSPVKNFVVVDAGMNDLARPSLYGSYHAIWRVHRVSGRDEVTVDVVGPICESGDFLAKDRVLARVEPGELMAVMSAGAYGHHHVLELQRAPRAARGDGARRPVHGGSPARNICGLDPRGAYAPGRRLSRCQRINMSGDIPKRHKEPVTK